MDLKKQINKSNQDVHVWRMNGVWWWQWWKSNSTFALLRGYIPFLLFETLWGEWDSLLFFFSLRWVSCTLNSTVRHLSIFTSRLTFSFLSRFRAPAPFYFLVYFLSFFFFFFRALIFWDNIANGSNKISWAFISQEKTEIFLVILSQIRSRIFLGGSGDGHGWYFQSRSSIYMSERASESWFNHMTSS